MASEEQEVGDDYDLANVDYDTEYLIRRGRRAREGGGHSIRIDRERMDEERFEEDYKPAKRKTTLIKKFVKKITPPEPVKSALTPPMTGKEWLHFLLVRLPIIEWVWTYRPSYLVGDIIAGITVAIMHIPQGLAYALLATLPAVYGLYASVMPVIVYSVLGTSKHISVGTFAVVELMIGNAIQKTLTSLNLTVCIAHDNLTDTFLEDYQVNFNGRDMTCGAVKIEIAIALALMAGLIMLGLGLLRFGFITIFLSAPLVSGYTTGAAIHVFSSQLKHIAGIPIPRSPGILSVPKTWISFFGSIQEVSVATMIISIISIIVLIIFKVTNKLLQKHVLIPCAKYKGRTKGCITEKVKWPVPIPSQLIVVIVATLISSQVNFKDNFGVAVVEDIPKGAPQLTIPNVVDYGLYLIQDAFIIAIVTYSVTVSLVQVFAHEYDYTFDTNQEFMAYGIMNIVGSFFSSFSAAGSLSRSSIQSNAGGKTQLVGFISSAIILVVLAALGQLFYHLPKCVLASIIWVALYGMFKQFGDIWSLFKISVWDMSVWLVVFVSTVLLGVDLGLGVGVGFSLLCLVLRTILPIYSVLGQAEGTEIYRNMDNFEKIVPVPGVLIYRFLGPVCFVNSRVFRTRLEMVCGLHGKMGSAPKEGFLQGIYHSIRGRKGDYPIHPIDSAEEQRQQTNNVNSDVHPDNDGSPSSTIGRSSSFQQAMTVDVVSLDNMVADSNGTPTNTQTNNDSSPVRIHTVIVDCGPIGFLDAVGVKTLTNAVLDFDKHDVQLIFAAMIKENRDILKWSGFNKKCGKKWLFPTLQDAVEHAQSGKKLKPKANKTETSVPAMIVAPDLLEDSPSPLHDVPATLEVEESVSGRLSPVLATDAVSDEFSGLRITSDTESVKDKEV